MQYFHVLCICTPIVCALISAKVLALAETPTDYTSKMVSPPLKPSSQTLCTLAESLMAVFLLSHAEPYEKHQITDSCCKGKRSVTIYDPQTSSRV